MWGCFIKKHQSLEIVVLLYLSFFSEAEGFFISYAEFGNFFLII